MAITNCHRNPKKDRKINGNPRVSAFDSKKTEMNRKREKRREKESNQLAEDAGAIPSSESKEEAHQAAAKTLRRKLAKNSG